MRMFEFDPAKSVANAEKHGIDFVAAQELWDDPAMAILPSRDGGTEPRMLAVGMIEGKCWTAVVTRRGRNVRLISCRRSRRMEERLYEQAREDPAADDLG